MSKVLIQLLLSMMVGVSAAVDFAPNAVKIRQEVKASLRQRVNIAIPKIDGMTTQVKTNTSVSAQTQVKTVIKENVRVDAKVKSNLNTRITSNSNNVTNVVNNMNLSPEVSLGGSTNNNAQATVQVNNQTTVGANLSGVDLNLKNNIKSELDLNSPLDLNLPLLP